MKRVYELNNDSPLLIGEAKSTSSKTMLLISGLEYELITLETPPVSGEELEVLLASRIRMLYPGSLETTAYECLPTMGDHRNHSIIVIQKSTLERYRTLGKTGSLLIAPSLFLIKRPQKNQWAGILFLASSIELSIFNGHHLISHTAYVCKDKNTTALLDMISTEFTKHGVSVVHCVVADNSQQDIPLIKEHFKKKGILAHFEIFNTMLKNFDSTKSHVFLEKKSSKKEKKLKNISLAFSALLVIGALTALRFGNLCEAELRICKQQYALKKAELEKATTLAEKIKKLELTVLPVNEQIPTVYEILGAIAGNIQDECRITMFELSGTSFKFEADVDNSLRILRSLEASKQLTSVVLHSASRTMAGKEHLSISGSFAYAQ